jgi:hypothetical protein
LRIFLVNLGLERKKDREKNKKKGKTKMKKYILIIAIIFAITNLFAQGIMLDVTVHIANPESDGEIEVRENLLGGIPGMAWYIPYEEGDYEVVLKNNPNGLLVNNDTEFLSIGINPEAQPTDYESLFLEQGVTVYNVYEVLDNESWLKSFDYQNWASVQTYEKCSFKITGQVMATDPGAGGGNFGDYGVRYNVNSSGIGSRDFYVQPIETWDVWHDFSVEFNSDYPNGNDMFFYPGNNSINQFAIHPLGRTIYVQNVKIEFEYVPDYENSSLNIDSCNTSGTEWHPIISWNQLDNFPTAWQNYFEIEIWRQKNPFLQPSGIWELLSTEDINTTSYIDNELTSPGGAGQFGIAGTAKYKIKLGQTTDNPNYSTCPNITGNEEWNDSFGFSQLVSIYYGSNAGSSGAIRDHNFDYSVDGLYTTNSVISFSINDHNVCGMELKLFNVKGQLLHSFKEDSMTFGKYVINWNGTDKSGKKIPSGMYLMQVKRGNLNMVKKTLLVK